MNNNSFSKIVFVMIVQTSIIVLVQISFNKNSTPNEPKSVSTIIDPKSDKLLMYEHIKKSELIREKFLKKRQAELIKNRSFQDIGLFEAKDGATVVWNYFPPTLTCPHLMERVGTPGDGGKWVCGMELFETDAMKKEECIVYSFGINRESSFEQEILSRTNCKVYGFDPTVDSFSFKNMPDWLKGKTEKNAKFQRIGLGGDNINDPNRFKTLKQIMNQLNHTWIDILKVDIESAEFASLRKAASDANYEFPAGHLNLEMHITKSHKSLDDFRKLWEALENSGFRAWFWEPNFNPCVRGRNPDLMEYSFLNIMDSRNKLLSYSNQQ